MDDGEEVMSRGRERDVVEYILALAERDRLHGGALHRCHSESEGQSLPVVCDGCRRMVLHVSWEPWDCATSHFAASRDIALEGELVRITIRPFH